MFTPSLENGWMLSEARGSPSGLGVQQGALQNRRVEHHCFCPWGGWSYNRPVVSPQALPEGVAACEWLWELLRDQSQWLREGCGSCVCERSECPDVSRCPDSSAIWALVLFRATQQPSVESLVNKHRPGWDILLTMNKCRIPSLGLYRSLFSQLHWRFFQKPLLLQTSGVKEYGPATYP